jgi:ankyrin repeat protein
LTAITQRNAFVVECLLEAGADLSARNANGLSALFMLIESVDTDPCDIPSPNQTLRILRILLEAGADATACDPQGKTLLMYMWETYCHRYIRELLDVHTDEYSSAYITEIVDSIIKR